MKKLALLIALLVAGCSSHGQSAVMPRPPSLQASGDAIVGWKQYQIPDQFVYADTALGHDSDIYSGDASDILKVDISGNETVIPTNGTPGFLTPNPDGNMYATLSTNEFAQVTPQGAVTYIPFQFKDTFGCFVTGSDQNLWILHQDGIGRMTTNGQYTEFGGGPFSPAGSSIVRGPDKNVWINTYYGFNQLIRVTVATGKETVFTVPSDLSELVQGTDGNVYAAASTGVYQVNMDGTTTLYTANPHPEAGLGIVAGRGRLWWYHYANGVTKLNGWSVKRHRIETFTTAPTPIAHWIFGADHNLWIFSGNTASVLQFT